jgi:hypothetical protein
MELLRRLLKFDEQFVANDSQFCAVIAPRRVVYRYD